MLYKKVKVQLAKVTHRMSSLSRKPFRTSKPKNINQDRQQDEMVGDNRIGKDNREGQIIGRKSSIS